LAKTDKGLKIWTGWKLKDSEDGANLSDSMEAVAEAEDPHPELHLSEENFERAEPAFNFESTSSQVDELCARVQAGDGFTVTSADIADLYDFPIDKFQRLAIEGFLKGSSVVVCAPTSSGKTLIAEGAAAATLARQKRLFYTTPLKALSNQKLREFRKLFGESNVGLLTGDAAVNREAPIMVMTTEILRYALRLVCSL
jgi:superfamily II RNA helicase